MSAFLEKTYPHRLTYTYTIFGKVLRNHWQWLPREVQSSIDFLPSAEFKTVSDHPLLIKKKTKLIEPHKQ